MPAESVEISQASPEDVEAVARFFWRAWKEAEPGEPGWEGVTERSMKELTAADNLLGRIRGPGHRMFLAKAGGEVVGFSASRRVDGELVELAGLVVLKGYRRQGLGSRLLEAAVEAARREGYSRMRVRTEARDERVIEFYRSRGFDPVQKIVEEREGELVEGWEMALEL